MTADKPDNVICEGGVCRYVPKGGAAAAPGEAPADAPAAAVISGLLGLDLTSKDGIVATSSIVGANKVIGLYFSAHWCPPCRRFTPMLAEWYNKFKQGNPSKADLFNIVFVSSDRDQASFDEYYGEMPWLALPFELRDLKNKLSQRFKVTGIPTFVLLDGATGELLNGKARDLVQSDPEAKGFPWKPLSYEDLITGAKLVSAKDPATRLDAGSALAGKVKLLYFSAHWCPPCRGFTPQLAKTYEKLRADGKNVECVFVSSDRSQEQFDEYLASMPWLALEYSDRDRKAKLNDHFEIDGIPTLVILDENDKLITDNGRPAVSSDPEGVDFPWRPKALDWLGDTTVEFVNEGPAVILYTSAPDRDAAKAKAEAILGPASNIFSRFAEGGKPDGPVFLFGKIGDSLLSRVLEFSGIKDASGDGMVILDIPSQCMALGPSDSSLSAEAATQLVMDFEAGVLAKVPLGRG